MSANRQLVEAVNGASLQPVRMNRHNGFNVSDGTLLAWLHARAGYWQREGYTMLHSAGSLAITGYNAATGNRVLITVAEVGQAGNGVK